MYRYREDPIPPPVPRDVPHLEHNYHNYHVPYDPEESPEEDPDIISKTFKKVKEILENPLRSRDEHTLPGFNVKEVLVSLKHGNALTELQRSQNCKIDMLLRQSQEKSRNQFVTSVLCDLKSIWDKCLEKGHALGDLTQFYRMYHSYVLSKDFNALVDKLFPNEPESVDHQIAAKLADHLRAHIIQAEAMQICKATFDPLDTTPAEKDYLEINDGVRGTVRHIAGYLIYSTKKDCIKTLKNVNYWKSKKESIEEAFQRLTMLESLEIKDVIKLWESTSDPESLQETQRRQNIRNGLLNICDGFYFLILDMSRLLKTWLCDESLIKHRYYIPY